MAVNPASIKSSVGSMNDLKPESLSRVNFKGGAPPYAFYPCFLARNDSNVDFNVGHGM